MPEWRKLTIEVDATQNRVSQDVRVRFSLPAQKILSQNALAFWLFILVSGRESKDGAGIQDEHSEYLSASPGRKFLVDYELAK